MRHKTTLLVSAVILMLLAIQPAAAQNGGSSDAAHACRHGGYTALVGVGYGGFSNAGECASFVARGGTFATGIIIPAGQTVTFSDPTLSACNAIAYGYSIDGGALVQLGDKGAGCSTTTQPSQTAGPFATAVVLRVYLHDITCGVTYLSDGNHAITSATSSGYQVDIADAGSGCNRANVPVSFNPPGNLSVDVIVSP